MTGTETVTVLRDDLETMMAYLASGPWTPADKPDVAGAWKRLTEAKDAGLDSSGPAQEPPLPPGEYAMIELPGYVDHVGWLTDGTRAGQPVIVVSDRDGKKLAEVSPGAYRRIVPLQVPQERPELPPDATLALPAAEAYEGYYSDEGDSQEPADAFPARDGSPFS